MGFSCGIIGLPNVGKSTIFSALSSAKAAAANFPFCTIEPNTGAVPVPDPRLDVLARLAKSEKIIPTQMLFVDIAGLIRGASKGEGLGNQFLGHIRSVDAVAHVVRCFEDPDIIHVEGSVDPLRDIDTIDTELALADLESVSKRLPQMEKVAKAGDKEAKLRFPIYQGLETHLSRGLPARSFLSDQVPPEIFEEIRNSLLTAKPLILVANVSEDDAAYEPKDSGDHPVDKVASYARLHGAEVVVISGKVESEIAELPLEERADYLSALGLSSSGLSRLILAGYRALNLITFFTAGPKETRAWTATYGMKAPQCAGKIHTDFERGVIRAEIISYHDYVSCETEVRVRELGKLRVEGKEYVVQDGDVVHFRFNV